MLPFGEATVPIVASMTGFEMVAFGDDRAVNGDAATDAGANGEIDGFTGEVASFVGGGDSGIIVDDDRNRGRIGEIKRRCCWRGRSWLVVAK